VAGFVDRYNTSWLIQRHGHRTPRRPTRRHNPLQRHDRIDHESVQGIRCCSPSTNTCSSVRTTTRGP